MKKISKREKTYILLASCAAAFFIIYQFVLTPLEEYYENINRNIPKMKMDLLTAKRLKKQYVELDNDVRNIRGRLDQRQEAFNPYDFLDKLASREGIRPNLEKITSSTEEVNENYHEEIVKIRLKDVMLQKLVRYLYNIENSGQLLTVKELTIEPDRRNSAVLDVRFEVSTFASTEKGKKGKD